MQVHIQVQTKTVLGTVTGSKNLNGTWAKRSTIPEDTPAVTIAATSGSTTAGPPPVVAAPEPTAPAGPETPAEPVKPGPKPKPPVATGGAGDERKAEGLLKMARSYMAAGVNKLAIKKLEECIDKYPDTKAGKQANELLKAFR